MLIIDAAIFIQGIDVEGVTTPKVIGEVKDPESRLLLESLISAGKVKVMVPTGELGELSDADIEILALAYELKGELFTDDYNLQNIATLLGLKFRTLKKGIKKVIKWRYVCVGCGKKFETQPPDDVCPDCGSKVRLLPKKKRKRRQRS